jgi:hypothetical protein
MPERKGPIQSATLYNVGTKKTGNDGNIWIITENKNNVKRWALYKKQSKKEEKNDKQVKVKSIIAWSQAEPFHSKPKIKLNNWTKWLENLTLEQKKGIYKIRDSYDIIQKELGIKVIEVILPIENGYYFIDYIYPSIEAAIPEYDIFDTDYTEMVFVYHINNNLNLSDNIIDVYHRGIKGIYKKKLLEFIKNFNKNKDVKCKWNGNPKKAIQFII